MKQNLLILFLLLSFISRGLVFANPNQNEIEEKPKIREVLEKNRNISEKSTTEKDRNSSPLEQDRGRGPGLLSCSETSKVIENRIELLDSNLTKKKALLEKINNTVTRRFQSLNSKNIETTQIEENFSNYLANVNSLLVQRAELISSLTSLVSFDCQNNQSEYKLKLREINQKFKNQNLEFNRASRDLRVNVFYQLSTLSKSQDVGSNQESETN
jgi:hypothetical protein